MIALLVVTTFALGMGKVFDQLIDDDVGYGVDANSGFLEAFQKLNDSNDILAEDIEQSAGNTTSGVSTITDEDSIFKESFKVVKLGFESKQAISEAADSITTEVPIIDPIFRNLFMAILMIVFSFMVYSIFTRRSI